MTSLTNNKFALLDPGDDDIDCLTDDLMDDLVDDIVDDPGGQKLDRKENPNIS